MERGGRDERERERREAGGEVRRERREAGRRRRQGSENITHSCIVVCISFDQYFHRL